MCIGSQKYSRPTGVTTPPPAGVDPYKIKIKPELEARSKNAGKVRKLRTDLALNRVSSGAGVFTGNLR